MSASAKLSQSSPYIGGDLNSFLWLWGGWRSELGFSGVDPCGGELGGVMVWVAGAGPGGQKGICLFGMGVTERGVVRVKVELRGGGVTD